MPLNWSKFSNDLKYFHESRATHGGFTAADEGFLAGVFLEMKHRAVQKLGAALDELRRRDLHHDNPAFGTVSLLRVLDGSGLRETAHTRMLAWMLNPNESHGFGDAILVELIGRIFGIADPLLSSVRVEAERVIRNGRRIDLWLEGWAESEAGNWQWLLLIEAKIQAYESESQLEDYGLEAQSWLEAKGPAARRSLVFLDRDKRAPATAGGFDWKLLGFDELFQIIWTALIKKRDAPGYALVHYYLTGLLSDVQGWQLPLSVHEAGGGLYKKLDLIRSLNSGSTSSEEQSMGQKEVMIKVAPNQVVGAGLLFYAKYPEESDQFFDLRIDEYDVDEFRSKYFPSIPDAEFFQIRSRADRMLEAAELDAKVLVDEFKRRIESGCSKKGIRTKFVGKKLWRKYWYCDADVWLAKRKMPKQAQIRLGFSIESHNANVVAVSWIWVRGATRQEIAAELKAQGINESEKRSMLDWEDESVAVSVIEIAQMRETNIDSAIEALTVPFSMINWPKLFNAH